MIKVSVRAGNVERHVKKQNPPHCEEDGGRDPRKKQQQKCLRQHLGNSIEQPCFEEHTGEKHSTNCAQKVLHMFFQIEISGPVTAILDRNLGKPVWNSVHDYDAPFPKQCRASQMLPSPNHLPPPTWCLADAKAKHCRSLPIVSPTLRSANPMNQFRRTPAFSTK